MKKITYTSFEVTGLWEMFSFKTLIIRARTMKEAKNKFRRSFKGKVTSVNARAIASPFMKPTYSPEHDAAGIRYDNPAAAI